MVIPGEVYAWCGGYATTPDGVAILEHDTYTEALAAALRSTTATRIAA